MEDKLTREEVLHVAELAKFQVELKKILNEVEKINDVEGYDDEILIAPWDSNTIPREDEVGEMLNPKEVIENAPRHSGNYIEVPVVISEGGSV